MSHYGDTVQTSVCLALKWLNKAVQIDGKVIPATLFPVGTG